MKNKITYKKFNDRICRHCGYPIKIRNSSGFCDHLYYPNNCEACKNIYSKFESEKGENHSELNRVDKDALSGSQPSENNESLKRWTIRDIWRVKWDGRKHNEFLKVFDVEKVLDEKIEGFKKARKGVVKNEKVLGAFDTFILHLEEMKKLLGEGEKKNDNS